MNELPTFLQDLVAIATRQKPGQVTHKIAEIIEKVDIELKSEYERGRVDKAKELEEEEL